MTSESNLYQRRQKLERLCLQRGLWALWFRLVLARLGYRTKPITTNEG